MAEPLSFEAFTAQLAREAEALGITPKNLLAGARAVASPVSFLGHEVARGVRNELSGTEARDRGSQMPIANWPDGPGLAVPQTLIDAREAFARFRRGEAPQPQDAVLAGLVMSGGIAVPRPAGSVGMFGGRLAKTADHAALAKAEDLAAKGAPREQIWNETGWFQGKDGKWRFEIDDKNLAVRRGEGEGVSAAGPISHPEFAAAYPEAAANMDTKVGFWPEKSGVYGWPDEDGLSYVDALGPTNAAQRSVAAHELQHAVQNAEGWTAGERGTKFAWYKVRYRYSPPLWVARGSGWITGRELSAPSALTARNTVASPIA